MRVAYHHHHHHAHTLAHTTPTHASFRDTHLREKHLNHISYAPPRAPLCASVVPRPCHCTASFAFFRQNFVAHTHHTHSIHTHTCIPHLHHTHSHLCHAARRRLSRCVSPPCVSPPTHCPCPCPKHLQHVRLVPSFLGIPHTHTHMRCTRTPVFVVVVYTHLVCVYTPPWPARTCAALSVCVC